MVSTVKRALISVTDKTGLQEFAGELARLGVTILSTGGTGKELEKSGIPFKEVASETGFPEILGGRVKTLHPTIHAGILFRRENESDLAQLNQLGIHPIDLVVVNLYDFTGRTSGEGVDDARAVEAIDIGGPTMIRAAAKNWKYVGVVTSVHQYGNVIEELKTKGGLSDEFRRDLTTQAFEHTATYDRAIADWFQKTSASQTISRQTASFGERLTFHLQRVQELRYGENPHQSAAFYSLKGEEGVGLTACRQLHGKELSFNNLIDADIALTLPFEFEAPTVAILKHTTPSGVAIGETIAHAEQLARECDPVSAFGGIVGMNRICDAATAEQINKAFTEVVIAPGYTDEALAILTKKKNIRLLEAPANAVQVKGWDIRRIYGGVLIEDFDRGFPELTDLKVVTKRQPSAGELENLIFGWKVVKYVKSNAVLFARDGMTLGIGAGQMSRVDAVRLARLKAADSNQELQGSILASDAFFPFPDGLLQAVEAGATAVIQPGGSVKDPDVIAAADDAGIVMVFTGRRHFRHA